MSYNFISGTIPKNTNTSHFDYAFLDSNLISRTISLSGASSKGSITLQSNRITGIRPNLCDFDKKGAIADFGCDTILCLPYPYNDDGKKDDEDSACKTIETAKFYGAVDCPIGINTFPTNAPQTRPHASKTMTDKDILVSLHADCGTRWKRQDNWDSSPFTLMTCTTGTESIQFIILSDNNLKGDIPTTLFLQFELTSLSLS